MSQRKEDSDISLLVKRITKLAQLIVSELIKPPAACSGQYCVYGCYSRICFAKLASLTVSELTNKAKQLLVAGQCWRQHLGVLVNSSCLTKLACLTVSELTKPEKKLLVRLAMKFAVFAVNVRAAAVSLNQPVLQLAS